jgi:hypothetical protein
MRNIAITGLASLGLLLVACGGAVESPDDPNPQGVDNQSTAPGQGELAPVEKGHHWTRDEQANHDAHSGGGTSRSSAAMTYHGGKIMPTFVSEAVFWGPSWSNTTFTGDKVTGIDAFYKGYSGSNYAKTSNEWTDTVSGGHQVSDVGTHVGEVLDTTTAASSTTAILGEVCKLAAAGTITLDPGGNSYVPVYTDIKRGRANFCAWHSYGTCALPNGTGGTVNVPVQFGFFFNLDGDPGCDPQDTSGKHSQGLAALANVSAHELSEARSDPGTPGAWYDSGGQENGDKCAWTFNVPLVTFSEGTQWKVQGEWSNAAYTAGTGYANLSGQKGCLSGL